MAAQSAITLNTVVHNPRGTSDGVSSWAKVGDTAFGGGVSVIAESVRGPLADGSYRARFTYRVQKLLTEDTSCGCAGSPSGKSAKVDLSFDIPATFTAAERQDLRLRGQALAAHAIVTAAVDGLEGSW